MKYEKDENYVSFLDTPRNKKTNEQNAIIIQDDYIKSENSSKRLQQVNIFEPQLFDQLIKKDKQRSYFFNTLVLACFNINICHFCFPYISSKIGILLSLIIFLLCGIYSYSVQSSLIKFIAKNGEYTDTSFAGIIQYRFGEFCAGFYEFMLILWYCILVIILMRTCKFF
jgi:hypothetical protein